MAFPGQRADPESLNVINRVLDATVTKVTSFESELAVISYRFGTISINLEIDESHTAIVVFEKAARRRLVLSLIGRTVTDVHPHHSIQALRRLAKAAGSSCLPRHG